MVTLIIGSQILKAFCVVFGICARNTLSRGFSMNTASNNSVERRVVNGSNAMAKCP